MQNIRLILFVFLLSILCKLSHAQKVFEIDSVSIESRSVQIADQDTVDYVFIRSIANTNKTLVFIQGSGSVPLFCNDNGKNKFLLPLDLKKIKYHSGFNLLLLSPPGVQYLEDISSLDNNYYKVDENQWPIMAYRQGNVLQNYIERYTTVIKIIESQIPQSDFYLFGHSQGSRVAAALTTNISSIKKVALASVNPNSRSQEAISKARAKYLLGELAFSDAQDIINQEYKRVKLLKSKDNLNPEEKSELSFTTPSFLETILQIDKPIYYIYGTHDYGAVFEADKVMLSFIQKDKSNLNLKVYQGREHNFYKGDDFGWDIVFDDVFEWFLK